MSMESRSTKSRRRKPPDVFPHLVTRAPFKTLFGPKLSARRFDNQRVEAIIKCEVLNRMSSRGMPESVRIR